MCNRKIKALSFFMAFLMLVGMLPACNNDQTNENEPPEEESEYMKGHDTVLNYVVDEESMYKEYILESGSKVGYSAIGLSPDTSVTRDGSQFSGKWGSQVSKTSVSIKFDKPKNILDYQFICVWIYSEKATGSSMQLCLNCQYSESVGKTAYKRHEIVIDFTGWKLFTLNLSEFSDGYGADYSQLNSVVFNASGWGMTPDPKTVIYLDSVYFSDTVYSFNMEEEDIGDYNYDHIKETLVAMQNGGMDMNKASGAYKTKLESYVKSAKSAQGNLKRGDTVPFSTDMQTTAGITSNYNKILNMALGYSVEGSEIYKDKKLLDDIIYALDYMHENYYDSKTLHSYPKRDNWWDWQIGSAQAIVNILLLIEEDISKEQLDRYLEPVNKYVPLPSLTMANRVDLAYVTIAAGALQKDYQRLALSRDALNECAILVEQGDGFYSDGSFVQHDIIAYTGSYGPIMLEALSKLILACSDTCFRFSDEFIDHQYSWAIDSFTPLMYHGAFFGLVRGRSICRTSTDVSLGLTAVRGMLRMTKYIPDQQKADYIASIIKEYNQYNGKYYQSSLSPFDLGILDEIIANDSITARQDYTFAKVFSRMDRPIAQLKKYAVGISLSSSRIAKYEAINEENGDGWYTGDGMLYVYTGVNDYNPEFWHNVNLYRLPGTTVTTVPRVDKNISAKTTLSKYDFVGGAALENTMVAAMQFESATDQMDITSDLNGKKAWFVFDDEIVCLGAGISCSDNYNTETVIENRRLSQDQIFTADGVLVEGGEGTLKNSKYLFVEGFGCVYLPQDCDINYNRTGGDVDFLELYIDHGKNFENEGYAYVLLPTASDSDGAGYVSEPGIEILCNNDKVMAVRDKSSGMTGYVFFESGSFNGVTVDKPCTVIVSDDKVAAADPTQKLTSLQITVDGKEYSITDLYKGSTGVKSK